MKMTSGGQATTADFVGSFFVIPDETPGQSTWHFSVSNDDIRNLTQGESLVQTYELVVTDDFGLRATSTVSVTILGVDAVLTQL
jgi:VCBS repeat-containing protein